MVLPRMFFLRGCLAGDGLLRRLFCSFYRPYCQWQTAAEQSETVKKQEATAEVAAGRRQDIFNCFLF